MRKLQRYFSLVSTGKELGHHKILSLPLGYYKGFKISI